MNTSDYFRKWYEKNKLILSAKRKEKYRTDPAYRAAYNTKHLQRYHTDPDYREKVLLQQRSYRQKSSRVTKKLKFFKIAFNGKLYEVYDKAHSMVFIGTYVNSIPKWGKKSLIPFTIFNSGWRYYTAVQLSLLHEFGGLMKAQEVNPKSEVIAALLKEQTAKMYKNWYAGSLGDDAYAQ